MLETDVLGEVALELGAVRTEGALELRLLAALVPQVPHQRVLPHVAAPALGALVLRGTGGGVPAGARGARRLPHRVPHRGRAALRPAQQVVLDGDLHGVPLVQPVCKGKRR